MAKKPTRQKRNPFRGFVDVMSEMNRAQAQWMLKGNASAGGAEPSVETQAYVPPADIYAIGDDVIIRCEVAGCRTQDINITVSGGVLTITGHRDSELDERRVTYYTRERLYGDFRRTMILPDGIEEDDISASVRNGLLEVTVAKAANAKMHQVSVTDNNDE